MTHNDIDHFYDGTCPLCAAEMTMLRDADVDGVLRLENIYAAGFRERYPQIDIDAADRILHGLDSDGQLIYGLDVTVRAWRAVGQKPWLACLRWPVVSWFADKAYLFFARHRTRISSLVMGSPSCGNDEREHPRKNCARLADEDADF